LIFPFDESAAKLPPVAFQEWGFAVPASTVEFGNETVLKRQRIIRSRRSGTGCRVVVHRPMLSFSFS